MAAVMNETAAVGRSLEGVSSGQQIYQSGESLAEWRSSEQVENGTPSTSPPYWDSDNDEDSGSKPSTLYAQHTWKIDNFSQTNKRELRSSAFVVGNYKWYILIYPQGCDVCNHLSLFLCVANHDKLLPGWSHYAQFTIAVVNKDPKKTKYSDTLHRFWKKEHDWGWKKFMELSKVLDGFIDSDTLIIKAQVQVLRVRADRPFRCLDRSYRRELVRVYLTNVEQICRRFVEEQRSKLGKLIEDKTRWSGFCAFWLGMDQSSRHHMSKEKTDVILKIVVKHFFVDKEVTSTLVMDSLYSGLRALEGRYKGKKVKGKCIDAQQPVSMVRMEKDMFVLVDDVLLLLERAYMEPLPPKDEKGPQNRTKDGTSGEDFNKESIELDERRLTDLGQRTIEVFVLAQIFSKIEIAYQEAVALKRQEELIREEEAACMAETELKMKRGTSEKEKKSKKKQSKQKRNNRKAKDKMREEKPGVLWQDKTEEESLSGEGKDNLTEDQENVLEKPDTLEEVSDISDSVDCVPETPNCESEDRDANPVNWDADTVEIEIHPPVGTSCSNLSGFSSSSVPEGVGGRRNLSGIDDSSSTCSTDSTPSAVNASDLKNQTSPSRVSGFECQPASLSSHEQHVKKEACTTQERSINGVTKTKGEPSTPQPKPKVTVSSPSFSIKKPSPDIPKPDQVSPMSATSRSLSAPLVAGPRPTTTTTPLVSHSHVHTPPHLTRSVSATGGMAPDPSSSSSTPQGFIPLQSYRNIMMGSPSPPSFSRPHSFSELPPSTSRPRFSYENPDNTSGGLADEFPHLDIINDLLDDGSDPIFPDDPSSHHHLLPQHFSFLGSVPISDPSPTRSCRFDRDHRFPGGMFDQQREMVATQQPSPQSFGDVQWQVVGSEGGVFSGMRSAESETGFPSYSCGVNGYAMFRPSNGF